MTARVRAFAKLNLSLRVVGRREDGYHEILSDVQTIDLADRIEIELRGASLRVENDLPLSGPDIAERAAATLLEHKHVASGVSIRISKGIPAGAGLGGGSSDAAAVLATLDRLTPPRLPFERLCSLGAGIGSDVPLFLHGGRVRMGGRGERVLRRSGTPVWFALVVPPVHCDTASVYARWDARSGDAGTGEPALGENDLLEPALEAHPELIPYHEAVASVGGVYQGMSGSGSTFYAAFDDPQAAERARLELSERFGDAAAFVCRPTALGHDGGERP